jgi:hypothetical protein
LISAVLLILLHAWSVSAHTSCAWSLEGTKLEFLSPALPHAIMETILWLSLQCVWIPSGVQIILFLGCPFLILFYYLANHHKGMYIGLDRWCL